jgi:hypothetical protein
MMIAKILYNKIYRYKKMKIILINKIFKMIKLYNIIAINLNNLEINFIMNLIRII